MKRASGISWRVFMALVVLMGVAIGASNLRRAGASTLPARLSITLLPRLAPTPGVTVYWELTGPPAQRVTGLAMAPRSIGVRGIAAVEHLLLKDELGLVPLADGRRDGTLLALRPIAGDRLEASYFVGGATERSLVDLSVGEQGVRAAGHALLALPPIDEPLEVTIAWDLRALDVPQTATSFGMGRRVAARATSAELSHALFAAGPLSIEETANGQRLVVWGRAAFDHRLALERMQSLLGAAQALFEPERAELPRYTAFLFPEEGMGRQQEALAFGSSFAAWFDVERAMDASLVQLFAHEVAHRWIGSELRLTGDDGREVAWFSEGFSVHYARRILLRAGLMSPVEYAAAVRKDLAAHIAEAARSARRSPWQPPNPIAAYHTGALYAETLDVRLAEGLDPLIRGLLARATPEGLPISVFRGAVVEALGGDAGAELDALSNGGNLRVEAALLRHLGPANR